MTFVYTYGATKQKKRKKVWLIHKLLLPLRPQTYNIQTKHDLFAACANKKTKK